MRAKIKIGDKEYEILPEEKYAINTRRSKIYPIPTELNYCPFCGMSLPLIISSIPLSYGTCTLIEGWICPHCDSFFTQEQQLLNHLDKRPHYTYTLFHNFDIKFDYEKIHSFFMRKSAFRQYILYSANQIKTYTLVYDATEMESAKNIIYYSDPIAIELLRADISNESNISINDDKFYIEHIYKKEIPNKIIEADVEKHLCDFQNDRHFFLQQPIELTTQHTLYIYNGRLSCTSKHHVLDYCASIDLFNRTRTFYVQYCTECQRFFMCYDDYDAFLNKFSFLPFRVELIDKANTSSENAEKSPLMLCGYTVSEKAGLTATQRHNILEFIMDYGILDKRSILNYLEYFIRLNENNVDNWSAVCKWEDDKLHVLNYQLQTCPRVLIGKLEYK